MPGTITKSKISEMEANMASIVRSENLEGDSCFVFPVVMLTEGVHCGSGGSLFYSQSEIQKSVEAWNSKPVVVPHPMDSDGNPCSACSPEVANSIKVGTLFNTKFEDGKLKSEAWISKAKLGAVSPEALSAFECGEMLEVSTGLFTDNIVEEGTWNGEEYESVAMNFRPDHLAILPNDVGACSCADGAGIPRLNSSNISFMKRRLSGFTTLEQSFDQIVDRLYQALQKERSSGDVWPWIEDVFNGFVVYSWSGSSNVFIKRGYTVEDPVKVNLAPIESAVEVARSTEYVILKGEIEMDEKELTKAITDRVDPLGTKVDNILAHLAELKTPDVPVKKDPMDEIPVTLEKYIEEAPKHLQADLKEGLQSFNEEKTKIVKSLTENEACEYSVEDLQGKSLVELRKIQKIANWVSDPSVNPDQSLQSPAVNFTAASGSPVGNQGVDPMLSPSLDDK